MAKELDWEKIVRECGIGWDGLPAAKKVGPDLLRIIEALEQDYDVESSDIQNFLYRLMCSLVYRNPSSTYRRSKR